MGGGFMTREKRRSRGVILVVDNISGVRRRWDSGEVMGGTSKMSYVLGFGNISDIFIKLTRKHQNRWIMENEGLGLICCETTSFGCLWRWVVWTGWGLGLGRGKKEKKDVGPGNIDLDESILNQIEQLVLEDSDASIADDEPEHQFKDDNIDSCYSQSEQEEQNSQPEINVLSKEQDLLLKVISNLQDSDQKSQVTNYKKKISPKSRLYRWLSNSSSQPEDSPLTSTTEESMQMTGILADVSVVLPSNAGGGLKQFQAFSDPTKSFLSHSFSKSSPFSVPRLGIGPEKAQNRNWMIRATASGSSGGDLVPVAPVQLESAIGQFLAQILQTHPHLLPAAIEQQLENLQNERDTQLKENQPSSKDVLHKRIAEVREKERRRALEEILYCLIVHKFVDNEISLIPKISETSVPTGSVGFWPNQEQKLESIHSADAFEMIVSHISIVLGEREVGPLDSIVQISKVKLGKLYAASIMYGYFLKRVDERYQLERSMSKPPKSFQISTNPDEPAAPRQLWDPESLIEIYPEDGDREGLADFDIEDKSQRLRSYVMYLDAETLQRYATLRSKEAISVIEKQTQALFGRPDIKVSDDGTLDVSNDEVLSVTYSGLTMLVLEAVAFGSFLWEAESYVESKYHIINN
ncbi:UV-B-induced protein At3g17800, chloroplastic-like [Nicotiana tabacum]|uniref:UV-B-induced protein At3g17800, chloroplastic-like n=1 Tax=Nicotiana tabacum TaxID=4097 RepID=A0A1S4CIC6_TOBAC